MSNRPENPLVYLPQITALVSEINQLAASLHDQRRLFVFEDIPPAPTRLVPTELGLIRVVVWLHSLYYGGGHVNVKFLVERIKLYLPESAEELKKHYKRVQELYSYLSWNIDPSRHVDDAVQSRCQRWLWEHCRTGVPQTDEQWEASLKAVLREGEGFLKGIVHCMRQIEQDDAVERTLYDWELRRSRHYSPTQFDRLIQVVAHDLGRDAIDTLALRMRYYDQWSESLKMLGDGYNFEDEARKLIEHVLLFEIEPGLPVTSEDLIKEFNTPRGHRLEQMLRRARQLYDQAPCSRAELMDRLRDDMYQIEDLTEREHEVLKLLVNDHSYKQIARHLEITLNTTKSHISSIYGKFGVNSRTGAVNHARKLGIVDFDR